MHTLPPAGLVWDYTTLFACPAPLPGKYSTAQDQSWRFKLYHFVRKQRWVLLFTGPKVPIITSTVGRLRHHKGHQFLSQACNSTSSQVLAQHSVLGPPSIHVYGRTNDHFLQEAVNRELIDTLEFQSCATCMLPLILWPVWDLWNRRTCRTFWKKGGESKRSKERRGCMNYKLWWSELCIRRGFTNLSSHWYFLIKHANGVQIVH